MIVVYQLTANVWRWQVVVGSRVSEGEETTYARARLRADTAFTRLAY